MNLPNRPMVAFLSLITPLMVFGGGCTGIDCSEARSTRLRIYVDVEGAVVTPASPSAPPLPCATYTAMSQCFSASSAFIGPGTYVYNVTAGGRTKSVSLVVGPSRNECNQLAGGFENVSLSDDSGA